MSLTRAQIRELADALNRCQSVDDPNRFGALFGELPPAVRNDLRGLGGPLAPIPKIVSACDSRDALDNLINLTKDAENGSVQIQDVKRLYAEIRRDVVLLPSQRKALIEAIGSLGLEPSEVRRDALEGLTSGNIPEGVDGIVEHLAWLPLATEGVVLHPAHELIERLALRAEDRPEITESLHKLSEEVGELFGLASRAIAIKREQLKQARVEATPRTICILVNLEPVGNEGERSADRFRVRAWAWEEHEGVLSPKDDGPGQDQPPDHARGELPSEVRRRIDKLADLYQGEEDELRVELFLPRELRDEPFDRWEGRIRSGRSLPLGFACPIVVRCRERLQDTGVGGSRGRWETAARKVRELQSGGQPVPLEWVEDLDRADPEDLFKSLVRRNGCACLAVVVPPGGLKDARHREVIQGALDAGLPLAIWLRQGSVVASEARAELENHLLNPDPSLSRLPHHVWDYRRNPDEACLCYLGKDLTLFWDDDPRRLPPLWLRAGRRRAPVYAGRA